MAKKKNEIIPMLKDMEVGETVNYPYRRAASVRTTINRYAAMSGKSFQTTTDEHKIYVKRIK